MNNALPAASASNAWWLWLGTGTAAFATVQATKLLTGSTAYDPVNIVDGGGATATVTVTGAALGDFAQYSCTQDVQNMTVTAWVSSSNTVSVRFQNESGGALDIDCGTLAVRVIKP